MLSAITYGHKLITIFNKDTCMQLEQFHNQLAEYELAYEQLDSKKLHLEEDIQIATDQLQQSETMRRRLNDHVTELQGQLAIEEQRSKFCTIQ